MLLSCLLLRLIGRVSQGVINDQSGLSALHSAGLGWEGVSVPHRRLPPSPDSRPFLAIGFSPHTLSG